MLDGGQDHRHWSWMSPTPAAPPPQSCREQKFTCTSTHNSKHHALPRRGGEGEEGKCTVVAAVPPRASHFDLDLHTALQHGQFRGGNISHEQAMVSRDTARVTPRGLSSPLRALSAASKSESDRHQQEDGVP